MTLRRRETIEHVSRRWISRAVLALGICLPVLSGTAMAANGGPSTGNPCTVNSHDGTRSVLIGTNAKDTLTGTDGDDAICGANNGDTIYGLDGNDWLNGNHGNDTIYGGAGDDLIIPGKGQDTVDCGDGTDTVRTNFPASGTYTDCEIFLDPA
jgi:Ca2+-binding RTX toxin-like protein